jgi:Glycosyl transferase 4-like domain
LRFALISTDYPPLRTSAAVQIRDLAVELSRQGHEPVVIVACADLPKPWVEEVIDGVRVLRLDAPRTRDTSYLRRTIAEILLPIVLLRQLRRSPYRRTQWDLIAWYSVP